MDISPVRVLQTMARRPWERVLVVVSLACGLWCLIAPFLPAGFGGGGWPVGAVIKGLAVSSLVPLVWHWLKDIDGKLLGVALACSSLGDVFLALRNGNYFVHGLLAFLVAHLFFITVWVRNWPKPLRVSKLQKVTLAIVVVYVVLMMVWILPVPGLSVPVSAYMIVLTAMALSAVLVRVNPIWIGGGAILFLISDSLIALSSFKHVLSGRLAGFLIWSTYYLAQYLMTFGFVTAKVPQERRV